MTQPTGMTPSSIGSALRALRTELDLTQQQVTDRFNRETGAKWFKSTLARVERGERTLTFDEAVVLTSIVGTTPDGLLARARDDEPTYTAVLDAERAVRQVHAEVQERLAALDEAKQRLYAALKAHHESGESARDTTPTEDALAAMLSTLSTQEEEAWRA